MFKLRNNRNLIRFLFLFQVKHLWCQGWNCIERTLYQACVMVRQWVGLQFPCGWLDRAHFQVLSSDVKMKKGFAFTCFSWVLEVLVVWVLNKSIFVSSGGSSLRVVYFWCWNFLVADFSPPFCCLWTKETCCTLALLVFDIKAKIWWGYISFCYLHFV